MMNGQDVNLGGADDSVHDPIRAQEDLANFWVAELRNSPPRVREVVQPVNGHEKSPDRDCSVVCRVGFDERWIAARSAWARSVQWMVMPESAS